MSLPQAVTHQVGELPPLGEYILPQVFNVVNEFDYITLCIAEIVVDIARAGACLADHRRDAARVSRLSVLTFSDMRTVPVSYLVPAW